MTEEVLELETEPDLDVEFGVAPKLPATNSFKAQSLQIRSKLGQQLYSLIEKDLEHFYEIVRDAAFGESDEIPRLQNGKPARSYGAFLTSHRRMYLDLMKMANADISVDRAAFEGDVELFKKQLRDLSTEELRKLVTAGEKHDG